MTRILKIFDQIESIRGVFIMTPTEVKSIREALGLTQRELGQIMGYAETDGRTIRRWETPYEKRPADKAQWRDIPTPAALALRYMAKYGLPDKALK